MTTPLTTTNSLDLFSCSPILSDLATATSLFAGDSSLSFYTDGSLINGNTEQVTMGIGWIQSSTSSPNFEFKAKILDWPSSTRAETILILSAIIIYPVNCSIEIFTDSQCCIDTFKRVTSPIITSRRLEKVQNRSLWHVIRHFINLNSLHVSLKKVKRHSNDFFNNKADILAKQGCSSTSLLALNINHRFSPSPNIIAWSLKAID
jgi:ribonuclease HI